MFISWMMLVLAACGGDAATSPTSEGVDNTDTEAVNSCEQIIDTALTSLETTCQDVGRNQACYGNLLVETALRDSAVIFDNPGDVTNISNIESMTLSSLNVNNEQWGFAIMQIQANLPDTIPGQNVTFILFGGTQITPQGQVNGTESFYVETGIGSPDPCNAAPENGLLIQTPESDVRVNFTLNGVDFELGSTAYVQAEPNAEMVINLVEGEAQVSAEGETQTVTAGARTRISLDAEGLADSPPSEPEPYDTETTANLPIAPLTREITPAPPAEITTRQQGSANLSTVDNPDAGLVTDELTTSGQQDVYEFDLAAGQVIFIDGVEAANTSIRYNMIAPDEEIMRRNEAIAVTDTRMQVNQTGVYQFVIFGANDNTGTYSFRVWDVPDTVRESISIDSDISGEIISPGAEIIYDLVLEDRQTIFFDGIEADNTGLRFTMISPDGDLLRENNAISVSDYTIPIEDGGDYQVVVFGADDAVGNYSFRIWDVPDTVRDAIDIDTDISGEIVSPGASVIYDLELEDGQTIFFDGIAADNTGLRFTVISPDGDLLRENNAISVSDYLIEIDNGGDYQIMVFGADDAVGNYSFRIWDVPEPTSDTIAADASEVTGELVIPGTSVIYDIDLSAGQVIFIDGIDADNTSIRFDLISPEGTAVRQNESILVTNSRLRLAQSGTYQMSVYGAADAIGNYSFSIWDVPDDSQRTMMLGDEIDGEIVSPGARVIYDINLRNGQTLLFDGIDAANTNIRFDLIAPDETVVLGNQAVLVTNTEFEVTQSGTYQVMVYGNADAVGTYQFQIVETE